MDHSAREFVLCPTVEGAYVRFALRIGESAATATAMLSRICSMSSCSVISESLRYADVDFGGVVGHRQVTDVYLASLAQHNGLVLATFDRALCALRPDSTELVG